MIDQFHCWKCAKPLINVILPFSRREECIHCHSDQHVCRMCEFFDSARGCNEARAEWISELEKANFCDYFKPSTRVHVASQADKSALAKAKLAALFGDPIPPISDTDEELSPAELAEQKLRALLGG